MNTNIKLISFFDHFLKKWKTVPELRHSCLYHPTTTLYTDIAFENPFLVDQIPVINYKIRKFFKSKLGND